MAQLNQRHFREDIANRLDHAKEMIETEFERPLSLDDMASVACMSSAHFLRQFKSYVGATPYQYLTQCRLNAAREMLTNTQFAITDIVFASGFGNRSAFSRLFKEKCGMSPMEFRRSQPLNEAEMVS